MSLYRYINIVLLLLASLPIANVMAGGADPSIYRACSEIIQRNNNIGLRQFDEEKSYEKMCVDLAIEQGLSAKQLLSTGCNSRTGSLFGAQPHVGWNCLAKLFGAPQSAPQRVESPAPARPRPPKASDLATAYPVDTASIETLTKYQTIEFVVQSDVGTIDETRDGLGINIAFQNGWDGEGEYFTLKKGSRWVISLDYSSERFPIVPYSINHPSVEQVFFAALNPSTGQKIALEFYVLANPAVALDEKRTKAPAIRLGDLEKLTHGKLKIISVTDRR